MHAHATRVRVVLGHAWARPLGMVLFAALTALAAFVRVPLPFTPVPFTLQVLPVLLAGAALGPAYGAGSMLLYLALGGLGMPWFAAAPPGAFWLAPTAGFLAGFPAAAWLVGHFARSGTVGRRAAVMALALVPIYALGAAHLALVLHAPLEVGFLLGVAPFVVLDLAKAVLAAWAAPRVALPGR
jgi:biotin transport system substrate-specific component